LNSYLEKKIITAIAIDRIYLSYPVVVVKKIQNIRTTAGIVILLILVKDIAM
tara:strand:- start:145 stop:300 length:156 start_codon:yes stop_codon:yes gene_type:complete